jgi:hypothetical protein
VVASFIVEFDGKDNVKLIVRATLQVLDLPESASPWYFSSIANFPSILERHDMAVTPVLLFDRPMPLEEGEDGLSNWLRMFGNARRGGTGFGSGQRQATTVSV